MKKKLAMLLSLMMVLSLAACGGDSGSSSGSDANAAQDNTAADTNTDANTADDTTDDTLSLWDLDTVEAPELAGTTWSFAGAYLDAEETTQEEAEAVLQQYGGKLDFAFEDNGVVKMVQGGGELTGTYEDLGDGSVGVVFDNNGSDLPYTCIFVENADVDGLVMIAVGDEEGKNGVYFIQ